MGRPASGSVRWNVTAGHWECRVSLVNGTRSKPMAMTGIGLLPCAVAPTDPPRGCTCVPCIAAKAKAGEISERMRVGAFVDAATEKTVSEWFADYYNAAAKGEVGRKNRGKPQASIKARRGRFATWIEPVIGVIPMIAVTSGDLRRVVKKLDDAIRERAVFYEKADPEHKGHKPGASAKSCQNVWSEITNGFKEAVSSKLDELRILTVNPALGVLPPSTADDREQAALWPAEVVKLLDCELIPLVRRRCYAVAIYTGMRRGELARLRAVDVDIEHEIIRVRGTKTTAAKRTIPIEYELRALLEVLTAEAGDGPLVSVARADGKGGSSDLVKKDLVRAGLTRAELTADDADHMPFTFHGCRHTCITHWTVAGRDQLFLLTAGGHTDVTMTRRYLAAASSLSARFGQPHPPLPASLFGAPEFCHRSATDDRTGETVPQTHKRKKENPEGSSLVLTARPPKRVATPAGIEGTRKRALPGTSDGRFAPSETSTNRGIASERTDDQVDVVTIAETTRSGRESTPGPQRAGGALDADGELRALIKAALDDGNDARAEALIAALRAGRAAPVLTLTGRRPRK